MVSRLITPMVLVLLAACATLPATEAPRVTLSRIEPIEITLLEQRYRFTLRVQNPNPKPLTLSGLEFTLHLNQREFASGSGAADIVVPALDEALIQVDATTTLYRLFEQMQALRADPRATLSYRIEGRLFLSGRSRGLPFEHQGQIGPPPARAPTIEI
jgi:LEA14-like dessication related protein